MDLEVVILAAGKGTRMKSKLPKVLHLLGGKPLLAHVIETAQSLEPKKIIVIYGHGGDSVKQTIAATMDQHTANNIEWIEQVEQKGTGHAVQMAEPFLNDASKVLVLYGDVPLIRASTLQSLINKKNSESPLSLLTMNLPDATGYGRILRDIDGNIKGIVEQKDANQEQLKIEEINTGILCADAKPLKGWLKQLKNNNAQEEYYLTDIVAMAANKYLPIYAEQAKSAIEVEGINDKIQLAKLERCFQRQQAETLLLNGVTLLDPERIDIRGKVDIEPDVIIDVNVIFEGSVKVAAGTVIGPNCVIKNSTIGANVRIEANTLIEGSHIAEQCTIGPFARVRPGTHLHKGAKLGNFVETKKTDIGEGSKVNHLSYIGDAKIGKDVNIGAGTITCNYDGVNKHLTEIEDGVFIGSNTSLIAPVKIGKQATTGAGSAINKNVEEKQLAIARGKQKNIDGWQRPEKK